MYSLSNYRVLVITILLLGAALSCAKHESIPPSLTSGGLPASSPANGAYLLENEWLKLENGRTEQPAAPSSASKIKVALSGKEYHHDLNYDGDVDYVLFLTYQGGGSGTFFYLAAALLENGKYLGTNAILLGDRIGSPAARVQNGLITVEYLDRGRDEPMTTAPSVLRTRYFMLAGSTLREIVPAAGAAVYQGWLAIGHEVRSFLPCGEKDELWLLGKSPALAAIISEYEETASGFPPYTPVFAILSGRRTASPDEGFGAKYKGAFSASELIKIWPQGNCRSDFIFLDSPLPGTNISSPLKVKGRARGTWFFEGDFPVILLDAQGQRIAAGYATAKGEWMTENFVDFEGIIKFRGPFPGRRGTLILKKDNPTGLVQFDDALEIPINFESGEQP